MIKLHNLPSSKTLSDEEMESVHGGLVLTRRSLSTRPSGLYGITAMNGLTGRNNNFWSFGITQISG